MEKQNGVRDLEKKPWIIENSIWASISCSMSSSSKDTNVHAISRQN